MWLTQHRRYNKYAQITARAVRQSLKETERVGAEKRGTTVLRYQKWENGVGGQQVSPLPSLARHLAGSTASPAPHRCTSTRNKTRHLGNQPSKPDLVQFG